MTHVIPNILTVEQITKLAEVYRDAPNVEPTYVENLLIPEYVHNVFWIEVDKAGVKVDYVDYQPYSNTNTMRDDIKHGVLKVSTQFNTPARPLTPALNLRFRALHDLQHARTIDCNFEFWGEICAFTEAARYTLHVDVRAWLFSEIVMQTAYLRTFGHFPEQKFIGSDAVPYHIVLPILKAYKVY